MVSGSLGVGPRSGDGGRVRSKGLVRVVLSTKCSSDLRQERRGGWGGGSVMSTDERIQF